LTPSFSFMVGTFAIDSFARRSISSFHSLADFGSALKCGGNGAPIMACMSELTSREGLVIDLTGATRLPFSALAAASFLASSS